MKLMNPMMAVKDLERTKQFYKAVLGLRVILDFGTNVTLTGGVCFQTEESWKELIQVSEDEPILYGGKAFEIYFEEDDFDGFAQKLQTIDEIEYVHPVIEHRWGQRAVRFYDPDHHIIEVGENIKVVCRRFLDSGLTVEETAERMDVPVKFVAACSKPRKKA